MKARTTTSLIVLLIAAAASAGATYAHLTSRRNEALAASRDLAAVRSALHDLRQAGSPTPSATANVAGADLSGRISSAASAAGVSGQLGAIQPGPAARLEGTAHDETAAGLRFPPPTLPPLSGVSGHSKTP